MSVLRTNGPLVPVFVEKVEMTKNKNKNWQYMFEPQSLAELQIYLSKKMSFMNFSAKIYLNVLSLYFFFSLFRFLLVFIHTRL